MLDSTAEVTAALGARVRSLRQERGWTLKQLGRKAGLSHPFLSQLERGLARPSAGSAERIARALQVPVGLLWSAPARGGNPELVRRDAGEHANTGVREFTAPTQGAQSDWLLVLDDAAKGYPIR